MEKARFDFNAEWKVPLYGLPCRVVSVIEEIAHARQAPIDYVIAPALAVLSTAIGSYAQVVDDYSNYLNLFVGVVGESASNKSTPATDLLTPLEVIDHDLYQAYTQEKERRECEAKSISKGNKSGGAKKVDLPPVKQVLMMEATPEARFEALSHNPGGILWYRDELRATFDDFGRYNKSGEESDLLTIFDGRSVKSNKKGEGMKKVKNPYLSILGTIQPKALFAAFGKTIMLDTGMVPRFIWFEPVSHGYRDFSKSQKPDEELLSWWAAFIKNIYTFIYVKGEPLRIIFADGVRAVLDNFRNRTGNGCKGYEATIWGKLHIYAYKLAGIAAVVEAAERAVYDGFSSFPETPISVDVIHMSWAIDMCYYLHRTHKQVEAYIRRKDGSETQRGDISRLIADNWSRVPKQMAVSLLLKLYPDAKQTDIAQVLGLTRAAISQFVQTCDLK